VSSLSKTVAGELVADDDHRAGHGQPDHHDDDQQPDRVRACSIGGMAHVPVSLQEPEQRGQPRQQRPDHQGDGHREQEPVHRAG
jgi:hypothetical protein